MEETRAELARLLEEGHDALVVAESPDGRLVGSAGLRARRSRRNRHAAQLDVAVLAEHAGRGLGGALLLALEVRARRLGLRRLELLVMVPNERAVRLYLRLGYEFEGLKRESLLVDGRPVDEHLMSKLIDPA